MPGLSPKLPLVRDYVEGYTLNKTIKEMLAQNLKNVILTIPGERIMNVDFGVGLIKYMFENLSAGTQEKVERAIADQVRKYVPAVTIEDVEFSISDRELSNGVLLSVKLFYSIPSENEIQILEL
tara:strand:+ start:178 stop:549 length:372 start_codon:yes stop_codon:yes gene_type:complete